MCNQDLKAAMKKAKVRQWQVADKLGVSEQTVIRHLRYELSEEYRQKILSIIEELSAEKTA